MNERVNLVIDGINFNASHYAAMEDKDAVAAVIKDHSNGDDLPGEDEAKTKEWATKAVADMKKKVLDSKKVAEKEEAKEVKENLAATAGASKAEAGQGK